jgi:hypothetical protein
MVVLALPLSMFLLLAQPLIDATTAKAVVLRALSIGFIVNAAAIAAALRWAPYGVTLAAALGTGYAVAALVVWRHVTREFGLRLQWRELAKIGSVLLAVALPSWLLLALSGPNAWSGAVVAAGAPPAYWLLSKLAHARWCLETEALLRSSFRTLPGPTG